jgi:hypothetical protein
MKRQDIFYRPHAVNIHLLSGVSAAAAAAVRAASSIRQLV